MRRRAARAVQLALSVVIGTGVARADSESMHYMVRAEAGAEYDTNVHRAESIRGNEPITPVGSPLARGVVTGALSDVVAPGQDIAVSATAAGKLFEKAAARDEDVAIAESLLAWNVRFATGARLTLSGVYYEAFQRGDPAGAADDQRRDFRSLLPALRLGFPAGAAAEIAVGVGYRLFVFKPDRDFDFHAPTATLDARWAHETADGAAEWEVTAGAAYEHRAFAGPAYVDLCGSNPMCLPTPGAALRIDDFLSTHVELVRTGRVMLGAGYAFHYNFSNSFGETVIRHFITARFAAALPLGLYVTARGEALFASYPQGTIVGQVVAAGTTFASIEDENRSNVRVDLSRNLTDRLQLVARYTFYGPALTGTPVSYRRQTALLSLAFTIEK